jgi:hypothetical protein
VVTFGPAPSPRSRQDGSEREGNVKDLLAELQTVELQTVQWLAVAALAFVALILCTGLGTGWACREMPTILDGRRRHERSKDQRQGNQK